MTCPTPPQVARANITFNNGTSVQYTCNTGYALQGYSTVTCENGIWNNSHLPQCLVTWSKFTAETIVTQPNNLTAINEGSEVEDWFIFAVLGSVGSMLLLILVSLLVCWLHQCGCCNGPAVAFGGKYVYTDRKIWCCCDFNWFVRVCHYFKCCRRTRKKADSRVAAVPLIAIKVEKPRRKKKPLHRVVKKKKKRSKSKEKEKADKRKQKEEKGKKKTDKQKQNGDGAKDKSKGKGKDKAKDIAKAQVDKTTLQRDKGVKTKPRPQNKVSIKK